MKKTKIVATLGPSTTKEKVIEEMVRNGVDVFRINMSHASLDEASNYIKIIRNED